LLLRRVALAFGSDPRTIRVIATSATLGTGERREQAAQLRQFLRDLTGAETETVRAVIGGGPPLDFPPEAATERVARSALHNLGGEAAWERFGPGAAASEHRAAITSWRRDPARPADFKPTASPFEAIYDHIEQLSPQDDNHRSLEAQALTAITELGHTRFLLFQGSAALSLCRSWWCSCSG
jgi:hypothetical protein